MHTLSWSYCQTPWTKLRRCGKAVVGNLSVDLSLDSHRLLDARTATLASVPKCNRAFQPSCNSSQGLPQRPSSKDSSRGPVELSGKSKAVDMIRSSQKQSNASKSPQPASSIMQKASPVAEGARMPDTLSPSQTRGSIFLPSRPVGFEFLEYLRLEGDSVSLSSIFRMALTCCIVARWIKIASALSMWTSRLRLKLFDSPLVYKNPTKSSNLRRIGIFWDLENCPVPSCSDIPVVVDKLRAIGGVFGEIQCFRAYGKLECLSRQALPFLSRDVELCPVPDGKESADKAIILDASLFALDHRPFAEDAAEMQSETDGVVVVTGDTGFAALLRQLSKRKLTTIVIGNAHQPLPSVLSQSADFSMEWDDMMDNDDYADFPYYKLNNLGTWPPSCQTVCGLGKKAGYGYDSECEIRSPSPQDLCGVSCPELDSAGNELLCTASEQLKSFAYGVPKALSNCSENARAKQITMKQQLQGSEIKPCSLADDGHFGVQISQGRIRVLRHLRCEVAAIADKYCRRGNQRLHLREFVKLYELEMGHTLIPGHYGFVSLKNLLQSMPDLIALRPLSSNISDLEIFARHPKGKSGHGKINYSRDDLRCIVYELLRTKVPYGVKQEDLRKEHLRITGRPLVLVTYEFLKSGDVFGSMRDILYIDPRTKELRLVDGAQEPEGYRALAGKHWR